MGSCYFWAKLAHDGVYHNCGHEMMPNQGHSTNLSNSGKQKEKQCRQIYQRFIL